MDNLSFKVLSLLATRQSLSTRDISIFFNTGINSFIDPVYYLVNKGFLEIDKSILKEENPTLNVLTPVRITFEGKSALEAEIKERRSIKFSELRAWITLAIAVAAFIKSFFF